MDQHNDHAELVGGFYDEQKELFDASGQGIYVFLDDDSRVCNTKFASMLGYASADEWAGVDVKGAFPDTFVAEKSQQTLVDAYQHAMEHAVGTSIPVTWKTKSGGTVDTTVILVPVLHDGHLFALHFVSQV